MWLAVPSEQWPMIFGALPDTLVAGAASLHMRQPATLLAHFFARTYCTSTLLINSIVLDYELCWCVLDVSLVLGQGCHDYSVVECNCAKLDVLDEHHTY